MSAGARIERSAITHPKTQCQRIECLSLPDIVHWDLIHRLCKLLHHWANTVHKCLVRVAWIRMCWMDDAKRTRRMRAEETRREERQLYDDVILFSFPGPLCSSWVKRGPPLIFALTSLLSSESEQPRFRREVMSAIWWMKITDEKTDLYILYASPGARHDRMG